jgi:hypothetical protein
MDWGGIQVVGHPLFCKRKAQSSNPSPTKKKKKKVKGGYFHFQPHLSGGLIYFVCPAELNLRPKLVGLLSE